MPPEETLPETNRGSDTNNTTSEAASGAQDANAAGSDVNGGAEISASDDTPADFGFSHKNDAALIPGPEKFAINMPFEERYKQYTEEAEKAGKIAAPYDVFCNIHEELIAANPELQAGDLVTLNSGSPVLRVTEVNAGIATCECPKGSEIELRTFPIQVLYPFPGPEKFAINLPIEDRYYWYAKKAEDAGKIPASFDIFRKAHGQSERATPVPEDEVTIFERPSNPDDPFLTEPVESTAPAEAEQTPAMSFCPNCDGKGCDNCSGTGKVPSNPKDALEGSPIKDLVPALLADQGYWFCWQANIALAFQDEFNRAMKAGGEMNIHDISNTAAADFLRNLTRS